MFPWVTLSVDFFVFISDHCLYSGKIITFCDVMFAGPQTVLNPLGDGVRRTFDYDCFWKELVVNSGCIDGLGDTT